MENSPGRKRSDPFCPGDFRKFPNSHFWRLAPPHRRGGHQFCCNLEYSTCNHSLKYWYYYFNNKEVVITSPADLAAQVGQHRFLLISVEKIFKNRKLIFLESLTPRNRFPAKVHIHIFTIKKSGGKIFFPTCRINSQKLLRRG